MRILGSVSGQDVTELKGFTAWDVPFKNEK